MKIYSVLCTAIDVRTGSGICPGLAKTQKGEKCIIDGRTPDSGGMCSNAFCALSNTAFIMMATEKMPGETGGYKEIICPHGTVTFRLQRSVSDKSVPFNRR